jgi:hypothetical protein
MPETSYGLPYPASTDDPRVWEDMQALAAAINTLHDLPDDVEAHISTVIAITSTTFATLPSPGPLSASITNPSADFDLLVDITFSAWMNPNGASNVQGGVAASGGVVWAAANSFGGAGPRANSDNLFNSAAGATIQQCSGYPVLIPAGASAVTFTMQALRGSTGGSPAFNYPTLTIKPRRFIVP